MALFGTKEEKAKKATPKKREAGLDMTAAYRTLIKPRVTEKSHGVALLNKYVFDVVPTATKGAVKRAVEGAYGVQVIQVNIVNIPPRRRFFGKSVGMKSGVKKAIVTLQKGDTIELFQGA